jgi:hypothetical protein
MQNISLGDYKSGRDTLQGALGAQYTPLNETMTAATNYGVSALNSIGKRLLEHQAANDTLHSALAQKQYEHEISQQDIIDKHNMLMNDEGEMISGAEEAMLGHNKRVIGMMSPEDQAKFEPYLKSLSDTMGKGTVLQRKGRMAYEVERNIDDPFAQARLQAAAAKQLPTSISAGPSDKKTTSTSKHKLNFKLNK